MAEVIPPARELKILRTRESRIGYLNTVAGIVLGGLLGMLTTFFVEGFPWLVNLGPLLLVLGITIMVTLGEVARKSLADSRYSLWVWGFVLVMLLCGGSYWALLPAREAKRTQARAAAVNSSRLLEVAESNAHNIVTHLVAIEQSITEIRKELAIVNSNRCAWAAGSTVVATNNQITPIRGQPR